MGRLQQIEEAIRTINDIAEMQRMAAEMEAANAEAAAAYAAEAAAAAAAEGVATPPAGGGGATPAPEATPE